MTCTEIFCLLSVRSTLTALLSSSRWNYECDLGPVLRLLHRHLLSGGHNLHTAGGPLLCGLHRCHPADPHLCQSGAYHVHTAPPHQHLVQIFLSLETNLTSILFGRIKLAVSKKLSQLKTFLKGN